MIGKKMHNNQARASLNMIRISPYKLNEVAKPIRKKTVGEAIVLLKGMKKRSAQDVYKTLISAVANATNNLDLDVNQLIVTEATVGRAIVLRRMDIKGRSRMGRITKPFSNLRVVLSVAPSVH